MGGQGSGSTVLADGPGRRTARAPGRASAPGPRGPPRPGARREGRPRLAVTATPGFPQERRNLTDLIEFLLSAKRHSPGETQRAQNICGEIKVWGHRCMESKPHPPLRTKVILLFSDIVDDRQAVKETALMPLEGGVISTLTVTIGLNFLNPGCEREWTSRCPSAGAAPGPPPPPPPPLRPGVGVHSSPLALLRGTSLRGLLNEAVQTRWKTRFRGCSAPFPHLLL